MPSRSAGPILPLRKRGRPKKAPTVQVQVRMVATAYDAYCRTALSARVPVRTVLRHVLELHAPAPKA